MLQVGLRTSKYESHTRRPSLASGTWAHASALPKTGRRDGSTAAFKLFKILVAMGHAPLHIAVLNAILESAAARQPPASSLPFHDTLPRHRPLVGKVARLVGGDLQVAPHKACRQPRPLQRPVCWCTALCLHTLVRRSCSVCRQ